jgi:phosphoribosyl-AMP cyclohydrolase
VSGGNRSARFRDRRNPNEDWSVVSRQGTITLKTRNQGAPQEFDNVIDSPDPLPFGSALKWNAEGLIAAIVQDAENGDVLMLAWMDEQALRDTLKSGQTHFFSRSRHSHWHKGGTSGHVQYVESIWLDCDGDVLLIKARQIGGACHEGYRSCFFRRLNHKGQLELAAEPVFDPGAVYAASQHKSLAGTEGNRGNEGLDYP